jgi:hypothetical protein
MARYTRHEPLRPEQLDHLEAHRPVVTRCSWFPVGLGASPSTGRQPDVPHRRGAPAAEATRAEAGSRGRPAIRSAGPRGRRPPFRDRPEG